MIIKKYYLYILFILMFFIVLPINAYADSHDSCAKVEEEKVFDNVKEAFDHCMGRMRDDIMNFRNYNPETKKQDADYTYHVRSDKKLTVSDVGVNWYRETGYISGKNVHEKEIALFNDTGDMNSGSVMREMTDTVSIQVLNNITYENGISTFTIHLNFKSRISKEQFDTFKQKMDGLFSNMDLDNKSDYEKYIAIWQWRAENIKYNINAPLAGNGIDTIITGEGVCSGISNALSYMLRRAGLSAYPIGVDEGDQAHEQIVVQIDGKYYFNETTMSARLYGTDQEAFMMNLSERSKWKTKDFVFDKDEYGTPDCAYGFHAYKHIFDDDFDCTKKEYKTLICKNCGHEIKSQLISSYKKFYNTSPINDNIKHTEIKEEVLNEADCENDGVKKRYCTGCGQYEYIYTPMLGHDYKAEIIQEGGDICGKHEITKYTCERCHKSYEEITKRSPYSYHSYDDGTVIKKATLEETGLIEYHCTHCSYSYTDEIPKVEPAETEWYGDDTNENQFWTWTKTSNGYTATIKRIYKKDSSITQSIDAVVTEKRTEPTCVKSGKVVYTAKAAFEGHAELTATKTVTLNAYYYNHEWGEPSYTWNTDYTTCTATRKCTQHPSQKQNISLTITSQNVPKGDKTEIIYTATGTFPDGTKAEDTKSQLVDKVYEFSNNIEYQWGDDYSTCNAVRHAIEDNSITTSIPLTITSVETEHKCDEEGSITYTAKGKFGDGLDAENSKTIKVEATSHDWNTSKTIDKEATCTENGEESIHCKKCNARKDISTIPVSHKWNDTKTVDKQPTCTQAGEESIHCKNCEARKDISSIPATGHQHTKIINKKDATCSQEGYTGDTYCDDCKQVVSTGGTIPVNDNHQHTRIINQKDASCTEDGYTGDTYCNDCKKVITSGQTISAGHKWNDTKTVDKPATCTQTGEESIHCKNCNERKDISTIPAIGHQHTKIINKKEASCSQEGYTGDTYCDDCKQVVSTGGTIPVNNKHQHTMIINKKDATCTDKGYTGDTICKDCNAKLASGKEIPAKGHSWNNGVITRQPTVDAEGIKTFTCNHCHQTRTETIAKLNKPAAPAKQPVPETPVVKENPEFSSLPDSNTVNSQLVNNWSCNEIYQTSYQTFMIKATAGKTYQKLTWKWVDKADGFIVYGGNIKGNYQQLGTVSGTSFVHNGLKKGTYYKYMVLAYKNSGDNQRILATSKVVVSATTGGKKGNPKKIALIKTKSKIKLKRGKSIKIKVKITGKKKTKIKTYKRVFFESSNPQIASVNGSGKVRGINPGSCVVYVIAQNGLTKQIKIFVH